MADPEVRFGPFILYPQRMTLSRDGREQSIGSRGAAVLAKLLDAHGAMVGRDELIEAGWPGLTVEDGNLSVQIGALRKAMGSRPDGKEWITTVPRAGYLLRIEHDSSSRARQPTIAVLPFANFSSDPEQEFVADGVVEDLITGLSRFRTFAVVARNSTFVYKGRAVDVREAARDLGVRYVLEGSVRRHGERIRVAAQLIEGESGAHRWAETFDGAAADIFDFQDRITTSVVGLIEPQIRKAEIDRARRKHPDSLDAWDLYVQALPLIRSAIVPNYTSAITLLDRALDLDPNYAPALTLASWAHEKRYTFGGPSLPDFAADKEAALLLAQRAIEADPDDALALALYGWLQILFLTNYAGLDDVKRATALNPNNRDVLDFAGTAHLFAGEVDDIIATSTRALELSPGAPDDHSIYGHLSSAHYAAGRYDEAAVFAEHCVALAPSYVYGHLHLAVAYAQLGRFEEAHREIAAARALRPDITVKFKAGEAVQRFPDRKAKWLEGLRKAGLFEG